MVFFEKKSARRPKPPSDTYRLLPESKQGLCKGESNGDNTRTRDDAQERGCSDRPPVGSPPSDGVYGDSLYHKYTRCEHQTHR